MIDFSWFTLDTGSGLWDPIVWSLAVVITVLIVFAFRSFGKKDFKKDFGKTQAFLSGNPEYVKEKMHVPGSNVYWGFTESMKWIYNTLNKMHTGNVSDYVLWFVIIMAVLFVVLGVI